MRALPTETVGGVPYGATKRVRCVRKQKQGEGKRQAEEEKGRGRDSMPQSGSVQGYDPAALMCKCQHPISQPSLTESSVLLDSNSS